MLKRLIWNKKTRSFVLWLLRFLPIKKKRILCVCWSGAKYNCNPRSIVEEACRSADLLDYEVKFYFAFVDPLCYVHELPANVSSIEIGSLEYFYVLATSRILITNTRFSGIYYPYKKTGQLYIFTGHGGCGIKKIEFDAPNLPEAYLKVAAEDTSRIDLMLSGARIRTNSIRTGYRYCGEILEEGMPRNDIFFRTHLHGNIKNRVFDYLIQTKGMHIQRSSHLLIYTPTFRNNGRRDVYGFNESLLLKALESRFGGIWYILISSHPNMRSFYKEFYDFSNPRVIDVGEYPDLQDLLVSSDILITDYSSAEMDFSLTKRPVFQLCRDRNDYDRGFYINPEDLPFPYAETEDQLIEIIQNFDNDKYLKDLDKFNKDIIGLNETGHASEAVVNWILNKM